MLALNAIVAEMVINPVRVVGERSAEEKQDVSSVNCYQSLMHITNILRRSVDVLRTIDFEMVRCEMCNEEYAKVYEDDECPFCEVKRAQNEHKAPDKIQIAIDKLDEAINAVRKLDRSREASIAITHLETAELWLCKLWGDQDD